MVLQSNCQITAGLQRFDGVGLAETFEYSRNQSPTVIRDQEGNFLIDGFFGSRFGSGKKRIPDM